MAKRPRSPRESLSGYLCWRSMNMRCTNQKFRWYHRYGGRGIKVCSEWQGKGGYERFIAYIGPRPSPEHEIDRIDNDGNYEPGNVRWALPSVNSLNRGDFNHRLTCRGETKTITEWARLTGCRGCVIAGRVKSGWSIEDAIFIPAKPRELPDFGTPATGHAKQLLSALSVGDSVVIAVSRQRVQQLAVETGMRFACEMQGMTGKCIRVTRLDDNGDRCAARRRAIRRQRESA